LETTFPETLHQDLASAVGLDLSPVDVGVQFQSPQYVTTHKKRDKAFREKVLRAYEYRCCVCGFDLRIGHIPAGLEAAHIKWHTVGGPDIEPNGLSLCALHHKLFDLGAFTLEPNSLKVLFSEHAISGSRGMTGELRFHGQDLLAPQASDVRPSPEFLHWNWANVFKQKPRPST
jgi:putative restriction endonuclease